MKIGPSSPVNTAPLPTAKKPPRRQMSGDVQVDVSQTARLLADSRGEAPVDLERVARLREQLRAGTYEIDDQRLAQALIQKELAWKPGRT